MVIRNKNSVRFNIKLEGCQNFFERGCSIIFFMYTRELFKICNIPEIEVVYSRQDLSNSKVICIKWWPSILCKYVSEIYN